MAWKDDEGSAFPVNMEDETEDLIWRHPDMPLRDWFAGKALLGLIINPKTVGPLTISERAYELADAMLKEREK